MFGEGVTDTWFARQTHGDSERELCEEQRGTPSRATR